MSSVRESIYELPCLIDTASSSLCVVSDNARMAGICFIVEYALRFVVARFVVDLLRRAIANLVAISGALGQIIISDIFIVRDCIGTQTS